MTTPDAATLLVLQHAAPEGPGAIGEALRTNGVATRVVRIDRGEPVPAELGAHAGLVVMGGPMGVYEVERHPHLRDELRLIETVLRAERPLLGICLGSQLIAAALGARVHASGYQEIGWFPVDLADEAASDPLFAGAPRQFTALHWHGDVFDLPRGALRLASSALTERQAFRHGTNTYGLLFHLEAGAAQVDAMAAEFADEIAGVGLTVAALRDGAATHLPALRPVADQVFSRFAERVAGRRPPS